MSIKTKNIPISLPVTGEEEWQAVKEPLFNGWLTSGPMVNAFEKEFAQIHGVSHAIAVTSATTALHLSLIALNIKPGDEVIVPAFTWISTANVVEYCGAKVIFCDIDINTFNIDIDKLASLINPNTKAIIAVHLFGLCADIDAIKNIAPTIPIIEDAACAAGATYKDRYAGSLGNLGCFSFHPRKSITTGEGGMITTNDANIAERISMLRNHGASISEEQRHHGPKPFILPDFNILGFNYRMTDLQGAVGLVQIKKLKKFIAERKRWADYYINCLSNIDWIETPHITNDYGHGWQSFVTLIDEKKSPGSRNVIMENLQAKGISTRPGTHAVHMLNYYKDKYNLKDNDFEVARQANDYSMAIPLHNRMGKEDFEYVINAIKNL